MEIEEIVENVRQSYVRSSVKRLSKNVWAIKVI